LIVEGSVRQFFKICRNRFPEFRWNKSKSRGSIVIVCFWQNWRVIVTLKVSILSAPNNKQTNKILITKWSCSFLVFRNHLTLCNVWLNLQSRWRQEASSIFLYVGWLSSILEPEGRDSTFKRVTRKLLVSFPILGFSVGCSQGSHQENGEDSILNCGRAESLRFFTSPKKWKVVCATVRAS